MALLHHALEASAERHPETRAVSAPDGSLTYGEVDRAADRMAHALIALGVRHGDRVGILLGKSIWAIVSLFGIHKAGAAYVPLDPSSPPRRLHDIVRSAGIHCLVTERARAERLTAAQVAESPLTTLILTDEAEGREIRFPGSVLGLGELLRQSEEGRPRITSRGTDLACVLYTSGSTGVPKGVMMSHLNVLNFVEWACEAFSVTAEDVVSNHAPLCFDLSIFDVFASLRAGAAISLVPDECSYFPYKLAEWIEVQGITIWYSVPSVLGMLIRGGHLERFRFARLRAVLFAGEVFPVRYLRMLMEALPHPRYYNLYGPTETNVITCSRVAPLSPDRVDPIPIGKPVANTEVFVVAEDGALVTESGIAGELWARGASVARGYWGDPGATREAFVRNPWKRGGPERIYRTGDIVRYDDEGSLVFVGRRDEMVKRRGYRIELGEIEAALRSHPGVAEVAAVAVADQEWGCRITVYGVARDDREVRVEELREHLAARLPRTMLPDAVELRDGLPRTSTGKLDRMALAKGEGE